jgi:predicted transcriptional regulator
MQGTSEIYVRVPVSLKAWLQDYAARIDSNQKQIVVDALEEYLQKNDPQELRPQGK